MNLDGTDGIQNRSIDLCLTLTTARCCSSTYSTIDTVYADRETEFSFVKIGSIVDHWRCLVYYSIMGAMDICMYARYQET